MDDVCWTLLVAVGEKHQQELNKLSCRPIDSRCLHSTRVNCGAIGRYEKRFSLSINTNKKQTIFNIWNCSRKNIFMNTLAYLLFLNDFISFFN